jgi:branched-chain amino acid transport system ATP-binding protein
MTTHGRLEAHGLVFRHEGVVAVDHVDLVAEPGRITAVIGPNGAGKTTLFDCLSGVRVPNAGRVLLDGADVTQLRTDARSRLGLARTFQHSSVFATLTVEENLRVGAENRRRLDTLREFFGMPANDAAASQRVVARVLDELGLRPLRHVVAGQLPTGTLRSIEFARAVCMNPSVLLLDEPASGLDDDETEILRHSMAELAARGIALLFVEHDIALVRDAADVVYAMAAGQIVASGPPAEVLARADVRSVVLGQSA